MNKVILGIVVALAIAVVGWFFYSQQYKEVINNVEQDQTSDMSTPGMSDNETSGVRGSVDTSVSLEGDMIEDIVVTYTDAGFEPNSVTANKGQTVRYINQSSRGMWVGSDNHPSHTLYPSKTSGDCLGSAFDTCDSLPKGQTWSFTFTETGSWGYHNHVQARDRGTVVVR